MKIQPEIQEIINAEADRCVKCALCAPVCPTYQLTQNESESPRGRIALAQGLANHQIPLTDITRTHLDHCLSCRACEAVCPSGVQYGSLFDATQALMEREAPRKQDFIEWLPRLFSLKIIRLLLIYYQRSGLQKKLRALKFFGLKTLVRYDAFLPTLEKSIAWQNFYPAIGKEQGQVGLFLGCVAKTIDQATLMDTIKVLTQVGYSVHVPLKQSCCGALDLHAGRQKIVQHYEKRNQDAFANLPLKAIISIASGCNAVLADYPGLSAPVRDICEFLQSEPWNETVALKPYPQTITLHTPCTLQNVLKTSHVVQQLLARIPQINLEIIPTTVGCCGAAGNHFLRYPKESEALLSKTLQRLNIQSNTLVLTSNIGCQLQLDRGLLSSQKTSKVMHPIRLIANCLILKSTETKKTA